MTAEFSIIGLIAFFTGRLHHKLMSKNLLSTSEQQLCAHICILSIAIDWQSCPTSAFTLIRRYATMPVMLTLRTKLQCNRLFEQTLTLTPSDYIFHTKQLGKDICMLGTNWFELGKQYFQPWLMIWTCYYDKSTCRYFGHGHSCASRTIGCSWQHFLAKVLHNFRCREPAHWIRWSQTRVKLSCLLKMGAK